MTPAEAYAKAGDYPCRVEQTQSQRMATILALVSGLTHVPVSTVLRRDRRQRVANARMMAMWVLRQQGYSYPQVGAVFGRDHSTVISACNLIEARMLQPQFHRTMMALLAAVEGA